MFKLVCSLSLHTIIKRKCESYKKIMTSFSSSPCAIISNCTNQPSRWLIHVPLVIMFPPCLITTNATRQTQGCKIIVTNFFKANMWRILHNPSYGHMPWKFQMECGGPHERLWRWFKWFCISSPKNLKGHVIIVFLVCLFLWNGNIFHWYFFVFIWFDENVIYFSFMELEIVQVLVFFIKKILFYNYWKMLKGESCWVVELIHDFLCHFLSSPLFPSGKPYFISFNAIKQIIKWWINLCKSF